MIRYYLDKQELYNPDATEKTKVFTYTNIEEISDETISRNLMIVDEAKNNMYYLFVFTSNPRVEKYKKEQIPEAQELFFPIIKEDTDNLTYCEVSYEQIMEYLNLEKFHKYDMRKVIKRIANIKK